jgi:hypothetical protein
MKSRALAIAALGILLLHPAAAWSKGSHSGGHASSSHGSSRSHSSGGSRGGSHASASAHHSAGTRFHSTGPAPDRHRTRRSSGASATAPPPSNASRARAASTAAAQAARQHTGKGYYNSRGNWVPSPTRTANGKPPRGATARCGDGSFSFSQSHRGTCSHHGGVADWLH